MKLVSISDLHLLNDNPVARLDNLPVTQKYKLRYILEFASKNSATILITGDMFDRPRSWYLLADVIDMLNEFKDIGIYCVYGQHDTYFYNEKTKQATSLGILWKSGYVKLLTDNPTTLRSANKTIDVYGCSISQEVPDVIDKSVTNVLVIHAPIAEEALFSTHDYIDAKNFLDIHENYDIIMCGDIHRRFIIQSENKKRVILNSGPVSRKEGTEYNMDLSVGFFVVDTEINDIQFHNIPHKKGTEVLTREHIVDEKERNDSLSSFIQTIKTKEVKGANLKENVYGFLKENVVNQSVKNILSNTMNKETKNE